MDAASRYLPLGEKRTNDTGGWSLPSAISVFKHFPVCPSLCWREQQHPERSVPADQDSSREVIRSTATERLGLAPDAAQAVKAAAGYQRPVVVEVNGCHGVRVRRHFPQALAAAHIPHPHSLVKAAANLHGTQELHLGIA